MPDPERKFNCKYYSSCLNVAAKKHLETFSCGKCVRYQPEIKDAEDLMEQEFKSVRLWLQVVIQACGEHVNGSLNGDAARNFLLSQDGKTICNACNVSHWIVREILRRPVKCAPPDLSKKTIHKSLKEKSIQPLKKGIEPTTIAGYGVRLKCAQDLGYTGLAEFIRYVCADSSVPYKDIAIVLGYHHVDALSRVIKSVLDQSPRKKGRPWHASNTDTKNTTALSKVKISRSDRREVEQERCTA